MRLAYVLEKNKLKKAVEVFENCPELEEVVAFEMPKNKKLMEHDFVRLFDHAMREGKKLVVTGTSSPGNKIIDTYSLSGFTKALRLIDKSCS